jgi:hypothetical protein
LAWYRERKILNLPGKLTSKTCHSEFLLLITK